MPDKSSNPSLYDYFYYDYSILLKFFDLKQVEEFLSHNDFKFEDNWKAYLYFVELCITDLYKHMERFIDDFPINRFLTDYDDDIPQYIVENYLKKDRFISRIYLLDSIREELAKLRTNTDVKENDLSSKLKKLHDTLNEINTFISKEYQVKRINVNPALTNTPILNYVISIYAHVRYLNIPTAPFFRTLPRGKILLQYSTTKLKDPKQYIQGYVLFFLYACECFGAKFSFNIKYTINELKDLRQLHDIGSEVYKENVETMDRLAPFEQLFKMSDKEVKMIKHVKRSVQNYEQLEFLFGNSNVKVINPKDFFGKSPFSGSETKTDDLLLTILHGELSRLKIDEKLEIIRFSHYIKTKMEDTWYSYAFYMHPGYWLIFDGIGYDTGNLRYYLDRILKTNKTEIEYTTFKIKDELLRKYYKKKDEEILIENYEKGLQGNIKGLLAEHAAVIYLLEVRNASVTGTRTNTGNTDIDVKGENSTFNFIVQAKFSMPVAKDALTKAIKEINSHFKKISGHKVDSIAPIKILFYIGWKYPSNAGNPERLILNRKLFLLNELRKNGIIVASYEDLDFVLRQKKENNLNAIMKKALRFEDGFVFS